MREKMITFYDRNLSTNLSSLLGGIVLGIKDSMPRDIKRALGYSGMLHVFAVSGLHMGILYGFLKITLEKLRFSRSLNFIIISGLLVFYCYIVGLSPSAIRATIMLIIMMLGGLVERENDSINSLSCSAAILLLLNPLNLYSISFQLSFSAVLGILVFFQKFRGYLSKLPRYLRDSLAIIISAQILVFPFLIFYFNMVSFSGLLINLVAVPIASFVLIFGLLAGLAGIIWPILGTILVKIVGLLLVILERLIFFGAKLPFSKVVICSLSPIVFVLYFLLLVLAFFPEVLFITRELRIVAVVLVAGAMILQTLPFPRSLEVTFIDVGQGDAIFIKTHNNRTLLIDGGGVPSFYNSDFDVGADIIEPFLYSRGINHVDIAIFTHFDEDHSRGLLSIIDNIKVGMVIYGCPDDSAMYEQMNKITRRKNIKTLQVKQGDKFSFDETVFEVINPLQRDPGFVSSNDSSVVIKMRYNGFSFLFTGDLERFGEIQLINAGIDLKADVLKVGHHGSSTSTSNIFVSRVKPSFAVISAGEDNSFGHPSIEALDILRAHDINIFRTDIHGAITFKIQGSNVKIYTTIPREL